MTPAGTALLARIVAAYDAGRPMSDRSVDGRVLAGIGELVECYPDEAKPRLITRLRPTEEGRQALTIAEHTPTKTSDRDGTALDRTADLGRALVVIGRARIELARRRSAGDPAGAAAASTFVAGMVALVVELFDVTEEEVVEGVDEYLADLN